MAVRTPMRLRAVVHRQAARPFSRKGPQHPRPHPADGIGLLHARAYHPAAADQDRTTERHDRLAAHGILTLHFPPKRIKTDAPGIVSELQSAIDKGLARPRLPVTAVPQAA
jgi:hypothetical protein